MRGPVLRMYGTPEILGNLKYADKNIGCVKRYFIIRRIFYAAFAEHGETLEGAAEAIWQYNKGIVDAICDLVPAVKPQIAMYEQFGLPRAERAKFLRQREGVGFMREIGDTLSDLRKEKGLGQKELASLLNLSVGTISNYENGVHAPMIYMVIATLNFYHIEA